MITASQTSKHHKYLRSATNKRLREMYDTCMWLAKRCLAGLRVREEQT